MSEHTEDVTFIVIPITKFLVNKSVSSTDGRSGSLTPIGEARTRKDALSMARALAANDRGSGRPATVWDRCDDAVDATPCLIAAAPRPVA